MSELDTLSKKYKQLLTQNARLRYYARRRKEKVRPLLEKHAKRAQELEKALAGWVEYAEDIRNPGAKELTQSLKAEQLYVLSKRLVGGDDA